MIGKATNRTRGHWVRSKNATSVLWSLHMCWLSLMESAAEREKTELKVTVFVNETLALRGIEPQVLRSHLQVFYHHATATTAKPLIDSFIRCWIKIWILIFVCTRYFLLRNIDRAAKVWRQSWNLRSAFVLEIPASHRDRRNRIRTRLHKLTNKLGVEQAQVFWAHDELELKTSWAWSSWSLTEIPVRPFIHLSQIKLKL